MRMRWPPRGSRRADRKGSQKTQDNFRIYMEAPSAQLHGGAGCLASQRAQECSVVAKSLFIRTAASHSNSGSDLPATRPSTYHLLTSCIFSMCRYHIYSFSWLPSNFNFFLLCASLPSLPERLHYSPLQNVWGQAQIFFGGKKYFQRKVYFRGTREMKTLLSSAKNKWEKHDKREPASKCKYLLKASVKSKPTASQQLSGNVVSASEVTAQEQAQVLSWDEQWQQREFA